MKRLYALLLFLFPRAYRQEYGDELQAVFNSSLEDAKKVGRVEVLQASLRELIGLPGAIIYEHLRERRKAKMIDRFFAYFDFSSGSWKEFFTALFPFLLVGGVWPAVNMLVRLKLWSGAGPVGSNILLSMFGLFIILFVVGLAKGLPRWSLPYFGFVLSLLSVYVFSGILGILILIPFSYLIERIGFFGDLFYEGVFWFGLLAGMILLVVMTRSSPTFQPFRRDWTLLCFIVYGAVPFAITLTFDEYVNDEPFIFLAFLALAVGAWCYLREGNEGRRFWALFGALALSMFIAAAGKAILVPSQSWPVTINTSLAIAEAKHTIIMWVCLALGMLVPLANKLLPRSNHSTQIASSTG